MEKTHRVGNPVSAGSNCCWPYYDRLDSMLGFTPKSNMGTQKECGDTLSNSDALLSRDVNLKLKARLSTDPTTEFQGESEMPSGIGKYEERDVSADGGEGNPEQLPEAAPVHHKDSKTDASEVNTMLNLPGTSGIKQQSKPPVQSPLTNPGVLLVGIMFAMPNSSASIPSLVEVMLFYVGTLYCYPLMIFLEGFLKLIYILGCTCNYWLLAPEASGSFKKLGEVFSIRLATALLCWVELVCSQTATISNEW